LLSNFKYLQALLAFNALTGRLDLEKTYENITEEYETGYTTNKGSWL